MRHLRLGVVLFTALCATAWAQEEAPAPRNIPRVGSFWLFGEVGPSYVDLTSDGVAGELDKLGYQINLGVIGSYYFEKVILDAGGGWLHNNLQQYGSDNALTEITTNAAYLNFALRYRFTPRFSFGPLVSVLLGGSDVSFSENITSTDARASMLVGGQALYEIPTSFFAFRIGSSIFTDVTILDRQLVWFQFTLQIGFPVYTPGAEPPPVVEAGTGPFMTVGKSVRLVLDDQTIYFKTAQHDLADQTARALRMVAAYLSDHSKAWRVVEIDGHADIRGTDEFNYKLSVDRAAEVGKVLINGGLPNSRVTFKAYGSKKAADHGKDSESLARNRRVEIFIHGATNTAQLVHDLNRIWTENTVSRPRYP